MTNLSRNFCFKAKEARRQAGISQSELAAEIGCKQSAISMFEQGDGTKLNDEAIEKLSKKFGIEISEERDTGVRQAVARVAIERASAASGYCPNPECPSNRAYEVAGRRLLKPVRSEADPVGAKYCALCGEILERKCPNCGSPVHEGAICSYCGEPYVAL